MFYATGGTAILGGVFSGTLESLFEHVSIGNIDSLKGKGVSAILKEFGWSKKAIAEIGKDITKNIVVNASEEWATEVGNIIADEIIAGELSNFATNVADNYAKGMTIEEAQKAAQDQLEEDILMAAASGGLMGGGISVIGTVAGAVSESVQNKKAGKSVAKNGSLGKLVSLAEQTGNKKLAEDAAQLTDNSKPRMIGSVARRTYEHYAQSSTQQLAEALKATGLKENAAAFGAQQIIQTAFATGDKAGIQQISLMMDQRFGKTYGEFIGGAYGYNDLYSANRVLSQPEIQKAAESADAEVMAVDNSGNIGYTDNRGESFERTDEFRSLQAESQGMSDEERQFYHRGGTNETVRGRISAVLKRQMDAWRNSSGTNNGILKLTARGNQFNIYEDVDGALFHDCFEIARNYLQNGELVDLHNIQTTEDGIGYEDCYNYLSEDGLSGFSITPDGDLISVFNASGRSGFLRAIAPIVKEKAKTLDCYASQYQNLMEMYEHTFGFKTASIMDYNMEFDHDNIAENHGSPKIAFMVNTDADVPTQHFTKDQYDEAVAYREQFVQQNTSTKADSNGSASFMPESDSDVQADASVESDKYAKPPEHWQAQNKNPISKSLKDKIAALFGRSNVDISIGEIVKQIQKDFQIPISKGKFRHRAYGIYKKKAEAIRTRIENALPTIAHELGHHLDKKYELRQLQSIDEVMRVLEESRPEFYNSYPEKQRPGEAVAEFIREYLALGERLFRQAAENGQDSDRRRYTYIYRCFAKNHTKTISLKPDIG